MAGIFDAGGLADKYLTYRAAKEGVNLTPSPASQQTMPATPATPKPVMQAMGVGTLIVAAVLLYLLLKAR